MICSEELCTACGLCLNVCKFAAVIKRILPDSREIYVRDSSKCIHCGRCQRMCPNNNSNQQHGPIASFAAWNTDIEMKKNCASGGVATAIYQYFIKNGGWIDGVILTDEFTAKHKVSQDIKDVCLFQNSKYTYSSMGDSYKKIEKLLQEGEKVFFVGLPCQVAALRQFINDDLQERLICADLVCHGTPPSDYFVSHMDSILHEKKIQAERVFFRDPNKGTDNFILSIYQGKRIRYSKKPKSDDAYQIGYHEGYIYRENCYSCPYAKMKRGGDLTLFDYKGFGNLGTYTGERREVTCILTNTQKGLDLISKVEQAGLIKIISRPIEEATSKEKQLHQPTLRTDTRKAFLEYYRSDGDFESAAQKAFKKIVLKNRIRSVCQIDNIRKLIRKIVPENIRKCLHKTL